MSLKGEPRQLEGRPESPGQTASIRESPEPRLHPGGPSVPAGRPVLTVGRKGAEAG